MTHGQALGRLIFITENKLTEVSWIPRTLEEKKRQLQRQPFHYPPKPSEPILTGLASLGMTLLICVIIGAVLTIAFGLTGMLSRYFLLSCISYLPLKLACFLLGLFAGNSADAVFAFFHLPDGGHFNLTTLRMWFGGDGYAGQVFLFLLIAWVLVGLLIGLVIAVIMTLASSSEMRAWREKCANYTDAEYEKDEDARIADLEEYISDLQKKYDDGVVYAREYSDLMRQTGVPNNMRDVKSMKILKSYIDAGRAGTVMQAVNEYYHDQQMQQIRAEARRSADAAERAANAAEEMRDRFR